MKLYFYNKTKKYDIKEILSICSKFSENKFNGILLLKSTVEPLTTDKLMNKYNLNIVHNPEFLSEKTASQDFKNTKHVVLGGDKLHTKIVKNFYNRIFNNIDYTMISSTESELMKLAVNNFYATKIQFFNEIYLLCDKLKISFENVKKSMLKNGWISEFHTNVPGNDGKLSYGGMCFPKDTEAFLSFIKKNSEYYKLIEATVLERNMLRN